MNNNPQNGDESFDPLTAPKPTGAPNEVKKPPVYQDENGEFVVDHTSKDSNSAVVHGALIERLLSPESIQRLMLVGGGLLVAGFLIWLKVWTVFKEPLVVATVIAMVITAIIGTGVSLVRFTRYRMAGTGLAFLGALAMPLQLWFYDAQGLITLDQGGHLWIPAALFCVVYAGIARVTRNPLFVHPLVGGIVMTGMLFLADLSINQFWNIIPQVTFLASVGWISVFSSYLFADDQRPDNDASPFTRKRYGKSLIAAGMTTLTTGLGLLLVGQMGTLTGLLDVPWMRWQMGTPDKLWTLGVVAASTAGFVTQYFFQGRQRRYLVAAGFMAIWSILTLINLLNIVLTGGLAAIVLSVVIIGINVATMLAIFRKDARYDGQASGAPSSFAKVAATSNQTTLSDLTLMGSLMIACFAAFQFLDVHLIEIPFLPEMSVQWMAIEFALAVAAAATTCLLRISVEKQLTPAASFMAGISGAVGALAVWQIVAAASFNPWATVLTGLLIPMVILIARAFSRVASLKQVFQNSASAMTGVHLLCVGGALLLEFSDFRITMFSEASLFWMLTMVVAAVNFFLAGYNRLVTSDPPEMSFNGLMSVACMSVATGMGLSLVGLSTGLAVVMAPVAVGIGLLTIRGVFGLPTSNLGRSLIATGNVMMLFYCLGQTINASNDWILVSATVLQLATSVLLTAKSNGGWQTLFGLTGVLLSLVSVALINDLLSFDGYLKAEILAVAGGVVCLGLGLRGWAVESETAVARRTNVSVSLWMGSLLVMVPTIVMLFYYRGAADTLDSPLLYAHEIAVIVGAMLLSGIGVMCQLRSATLVGVAGVGVYLLSLLTMIRFPAMLQNAAVLMMIGGGLFFGIGLLLSIYRDWVISLPNRVREGRGLFQILKWR